METEKGDIVEEITSLKYTKIESTIADYILNHIDTVGFVPLLELAERIGVSDTSVIRFVRKLGFTGYAEFRNAMNSRLSKQYLQPSPLLPGERFAQTRDQLKETTLCRDVASLVLDNIEQTMKAMDEAVIAQIADILTHSKRKYVVGFRSTVSVASYLSRRLTLLLPDVKEIFTADSYALQSLVDSGKKDCVVIYSFPRYSELVKTIIKIAKENGTKIILITDSRTNELAGEADLVISTKIKGLGFANCYVAPAVITDMILLFISVRSKEVCRRRLQRIDSLVSETKLY